MINKCINGRLHNKEFKLTKPTTKIKYRDGYYLRSSIREADAIVLWTWRSNKDRQPSPINPH